MSDPISKIKGMTAEIQAKFEAEGIKNTQQLLEHTGTDKERSTLAHTIGITPQQLKEFANRADLMRLKGVGGDFANLLEEAGVNSCKELQHRKAENLHHALAELQAAKKIAHHMPTLQQVTEWVAEAQAPAQNSHA